MTKQGKSSSSSAQATKKSTTKPAAKPVVAAPKPAPAAKPVVAAPKPAPSKTPEITPVLRPKPGYHFVVQRGVMTEERDEPTAAPTPELKYGAKPAPPGSGPARYFPPVAKPAAPKAAPVVAKPAAPKAAPKAAPVAAKPAAAPKPAETSAWGRVGSGAECYKRILMTPGSTLTEAQVHAAVSKEVGAAGAGPLGYVKWYRAWLIKHGHKPTCGNGGA
jgi:hypothetical protein